MQEPNHEFTFFVLLPLALKFSPVLSLQDGIMLLANRGEFKVGMESRYRLTAVEIWGNAPARVSLVRVMSDALPWRALWRG
jgi:hypothetical protein